MGNITMDDPHSLSFKMIYLIKNAWGWIIRNQEDTSQNDLMMELKIQFNSVIVLH